MGHLDKHSRPTHHENKIIPAGYRLTIHSYENDLDAASVEIVEGLSEDRTRFLLDMCRVCGAGGHGNLYDASAEELRAACLALQAVMLQHMEVLTDEEKALALGELDLDDDELVWCEVSEGLQEFMSNLLSSGDEYAFREFNGATVEFVPTEITLEDVSDRFGV